jgi:hypothetical protein
MRKIYLAFVLLMSASVAFGQIVDRTALQPPYQPTKPAVNAVANPQLPVWAHQNDNVARKGADSTAYWVNFIEAIDDFYGGTGQSGSPPLWQDSLPVLTSGDGSTSFHWWIHGVGQTFQPASLYFANQTEVATIDNENNVEWFTPQHAFIIDSLQVYFWYTRQNDDTTVVDQLDVWVLDPNDIDMGGSGFGYVFNGWPTASDTVRGVSLFPYNYVSPTVPGTPAGNLTTFNLTHNDGDSLLQARTIVFSPPKVLPVNTTTIENLLGVAMQYKSGQTYSLGDTLIEQSGMYTVSNTLNSLSVLTYEEVASSYPLTPFDNVSFNHGHILPTATRYNVSTGFNGSYVPATAYAAGFVYEHVYMDWHVTPIGANFIKTSENGLAISVAEDCNFSPDTYNWSIEDTGGTVFSYTGATASHTFAQPGTFAVTLDATNTGAGAQFSVTKMITVDWPVGYRNLDSDFQVGVYPNPANQLVNIDISAASIQDLDISIVDMVGRVVYSEQTSTSAYRQQLDVSNFANGVYFVKVKSGDNATSHKLILAH